MSMRLCYCCRQPTNEVHTAGILGQVLCNPCWLESGGKESVCPTCGVALKPPLGRPTLWTVDVQIYGEPKTVRYNVAGASMEVAKQRAREAFLAELGEDLCISAVPTSVLE